MPTQPTEAGPTITVMSLMSKVRFSNLSNAVVLLVCGQVLNTRPILRPVMFTPVHTALGNGMSMVDILGGPTKSEWANLGRLRRGGGI